LGGYNDGYTQGHTQLNKKLNGEKVNLVFRGFKQR
jgi:hypothetical protein